MAIEAGEMMVILASIVNDDAKQRRLAEIHEAMKELEAQQAQFKKDGEETRQVAQQARADLTAARQVEADNAYRAAELDKREKAMGEVSDALNAEKAAFEKVRANVDDAHALREKDLQDRAALLEQQTNSLAERAAEVAKGESVVLKRAAELEAKHKRLHAALAENEGTEGE